MTGLGSRSHGRSHRSSEAESGQGNTVSNVPPTFVSAMMKPLSDTRQSEPTVPSNGEVEPLAANKDSVLVVTEPPQFTLTWAVTFVPAAGASTWNSAWSALPTLPPASSSETTAPVGEHVSDTLYTNRHRFST